MNCSRNDYCISGTRWLSSRRIPQDTCAGFSAERFHSEGPLQWLQCLENLAAATAKGATKAATRAASHEGELGVDSSSGPNALYGGFGGGLGSLPPSFLLWRSEQRLQRLHAGQLVRAAAALQQLGLRECPSPVGTQKDSTDVAFLLLQELNIRLKCGLRCLSLREIAIAAKTLSSWRFAGEDPAAVQQQYREQQQRQQGIYVADPLKLRLSTFRLLLASSAAQLRCMFKQQQHRQPRVGSFVLTLLHACARLQLTELRESYLLLLPLLQWQIENTRSLLQLALLLHCCTRLLLPDAPAYRQALQRLRDWHDFELLLQEERQPAAAQVALGQLALCCVSFAPWQMKALELQQQQQQQQQPLLEEHQEGPQRVLSGCSNGVSILSISALQEAVLLNVFRAAASSILWPCDGGLAGDPAAANNQRHLGRPSAFLVRQLQIAALAFRHEHPSLLARVEAPFGGAEEASKGHLRDVRQLLSLLETPPADAARRPRGGRSSSEQHANVAAALHALGVTAEKEGRVGPYEADLLLPDMRCVVEVDGPLHFVRPPPFSSSKQPRHPSAAAPASPEFGRASSSSSSSPTWEGSLSYAGLWGPPQQGGGPFLVYDVKSALKHRLLKASGWGVLHIAWNDWPRDTHSQHRAIAQMLRHAKEQQQAQQIPEVGMRWGGCDNNSLLFYEPQFPGIQRDRAGIQQQEAHEEQPCHCSLT